jgi:hypothetical protein
VFFFLGELGLLLWMLVPSVVILRARDVPEPPETPRSSSGPSAPIMPNDDTSESLQGGQPTAVHKRSTPPS